MRLFLHAFVLLIFVGLLTSTLPADEKSVDKTDKTTDQPDTTKNKSDKSKSAKAKKEKFEYTSPPYVGKITKLDDAKRRFTLELKAGYRDLQRAAANDYHQASRMLEISQDKNPLSRQRQLVELQMDMQRRRNDEVVTKAGHQEFAADENLKVRIKDPPTGYDDKGNVKQLTKAERKKLKGPDPSLPGYTAEFEQVHVNQYVWVYLPKPKAQKGTAKRDDPDVEPAVPKIVMIYIVGEDKSAH